MVVSAYPWQSSRHKGCFCVRGRPPPPTVRPIGPIEPVGPTEPRRHSNPSARPLPTPPPHVGQCPIHKAPASEHRRVHKNLRPAVSDLQPAPNWVCLALFSRCTKPPRFALTLSPKSVYRSLHPGANWLCFTYSGAKTAPDDPISPPTARKSQRRAGRAVTDSRFPVHPKLSGSPIDYSRFAIETNPNSFPYTLHGPIAGVKRNSIVRGDAVRRSTPLRQARGMLPRAYYERTPQLIRPARNATMGTVDEGDADVEARSERTSPPPYIRAVPSPMS